MKEYYLKYHILFCTKYKRKVLTAEILKRLSDLFDESEKNFEIEFYVLSSNQVKITVIAKPEVSPHQIVARLKNYSARILTKEFPEIRTKLPSLWTRAYIISTEELESKEIENFINRQKKDSHSSNG